VVGVDTHQRRHVERRREPRLALVDEIVEPLVCCLGGAEAGKLAHRPGAPAVHRGVDSARERWLTRKSQVGLVIDVGDILRRVESVDLEIRDGRKAVLALAVRVEHRLEAGALPVLATLAYRRQVVLVEHTPALERHRKEDSDNRPNRLSTALYCLPALT
jgi:hypothetical protein